MNILNFRIFILLCLLAMAGISLLVFFVREKPIRKMIDLSFTYLLLITFIIYILVIKNFETILFPIFIIIFINFLLTLTTGISIVNNLLANNKLKENIDINNDDWGYNYETIDDDENDAKKQLTEYNKISNGKDEQSIQKEITEQQENKYNHEDNTEDNEDNKNNEENEEDNDDDYNYKIFKDDNELMDKNIKDNDKHTQNNNKDDDDKEDDGDKEDNEDIDIEDIKIEDLKKAFKNTNKDNVKFEEENSNFNFEEMVKNLDVHNEKNEEFNKNIDNDTEQKLKKMHKVADMIKDQKLNNKGGTDESN